VEPFSPEAGPSKTRSSQAPALGTTGERGKSLPVAKSEFPAEPGEMAPVLPAAMAPRAPAALVRRKTLPRGYSWEPLAKPAGNPPVRMTPVSRLRAHLF